MMTISLVNDVTERCSERVLWSVGLSPLSTLFSSWRYLDVTEGMGIDTLFIVPHHGSIMPKTP